MQRLTGLDATFLYLETPSAHMHVAGLMVLDPSTAEDGVSLDRVKEVYGERLHLAPPFRRRLAEVPFGLHHPLWIEDPDFDLDYHIRRTALPSPGTPESSPTLVGRLVALPLDRTRPLWEMWVIEGLEDGNVAVLTKVHHAAIDGASGNELTVALLDLTPEIAHHEPDQEWVPDRVPSDPELLGYAATSLARQPVRVAKAMAKTAGAALAVRRRNREVPDARSAAGAVLRAAHVVQHRAHPAAQLRLHLAVAPGRQGRQERPPARPSTTSCWRSAPARCGATSRTTARSPTGRWWRWCRCRCAPRTSATPWATG